MISNVKKWQTFEKNMIKKEKINIARNFKILDALYNEAVRFKVLPIKDSLEGLDELIRFAKAVNSV